LSHRRKAVLIYVLVLVLFVLLTLFYTRPLVTEANNHTMRENTGDTMFNIYVLSWTAHSLETNPLNLFNATLFYPNRYTLAYSDDEFMSSLLALPVLALTGNGVLAFNFVILMSFVIAAFGAYLLVWHLTGDRYAAFTGGIVFGFSTYRLAHITHMQLLSMGFLPLAFLCLHLFTEKRKPVYAFLFSVFSIALFWSVWSYGFYLAFAVLIYLVILALMERKRIVAVLRCKASLGERKAAYRWVAFFVASVVLIGVVLAPFILPYLKSQKLNPGFSRDINEVASYSGDVTDFLVAPPQSLVWGKATSLFRPDPYTRGNGSERSLFPGLLPLLLSIGGIVFLSSRGRNRRDRFALAFYVTLLLVAGVMCLGVAFYAFGHHSNILMPYKFLYKFFPGFKAIRTPTRIFVLCLLSFAVLSGFGVKWLRSKLDGHLDRIAVAGLLAVLLILMVVEILPTGIEMRPMLTKARFPSVFRWMAGIDGNAPTIVLPVAPYDSKSVNRMDDLAYVGMEPERDYFNTANWKPMVNGYSGYVPVSYKDAVRSEEDFPSRAALRYLKRLKVKYVILESKRYDHGRFASILERVKRKPELVPRYQSDGYYAYELR